MTSSARQRMTSTRSSAAAPAGAAVEGVRAARALERPGLAPVPARAQDVLAQPERGVLQLPAAAAVPRLLRRAARTTTSDLLHVIVPGIAGMAVMSTTFNALAFNITALREHGILKRVRGTPLPTSAYLAGIGGSAVTNTALQIAIIIGRRQACCSGSAGRTNLLALVVLRRPRRRLLRLARRRALARDPELRRGARLRERRVPAADLHLRRLLRRRRRAARDPATPPRRCRSST